MATTTKLRTMVVLGSTRNASPPWGGPKRLGDRVSKFLLQQLKDRTAVTHDIDYVDLLEVDLPLLRQAHHWYAPGTAPPELEKLSQRIVAADCYVFISPEYNHSMSPAITNFLNHFAPANYSFKPSLIAVYSGGPFAGYRAAMQMRTITSIIGCVSVPPIFAVPTAHNSLDENGKLLPPDGALLENQATNTLSHLEWMALAMKQRRDTVGIPREL